MELMKRLERFETPDVRSPICRKRKVGDGVLASQKPKMADCRWLMPVLVGQFEFLEWTGENHLRHSKFMGMREGKNARDVVRES